jgi:hypothetical protein
MKSAALLQQLKVRSLSFPIEASDLIEKFEPTGRHPTVGTPDLQRLESRHVKQKKTTSLLKN